MSDLMMQRDQSIGSNLYPQENSGPVELLPNPDFVFPPRSPNLVSSNVAGWAAFHQQRRSVPTVMIPQTSTFSSRPQKSPVALPDFVFNASAPTSASPFSTPPHSPTFASPSTPSRTRHRRGGSEFIGRDRDGMVNVVSSSPEKSEAPERPLHLGPPPGRRHTHRRSGAVSMQDLSSILQPRDPNLQNRSGSAPTTPLETEKLPIFGLEQVLAAGEAAAAVEPQVNESPQKRPPSRARVGFADRVEYIRPLSIISSETESSMSTIRGHSVTNSFSSGVSGTTSTRMARPSLETVTDAGQIRPHTSHVVESTPRRASVPELGRVERPRSSSCASDSSVTMPRPKKKGFHWWEAKHKPAEPEDSKSFKTNTPPRSPLSSRKSLESDQETVKATQHTNRKPRKVRSWAHSLISRKGKSKKDHPRLPTPQASNESLASSEFSQPENGNLNFEPNFDDDNTITIITEATHIPVNPVNISNVQSELSPGVDVLSPVIDLDAAMGPFNTPPLASNIRGTRLPPRARRSMHSLVGAQPHRRTESAPELVPFDPRNFKLVPTSPMPDVFEEDDEELAGEPDTPTESSAAAEAQADVESREDSVSHEESSVGVHVVEIDETLTASNPFRRSIGGFGPSRRKKSEGLSISIDSPVLAQDHRLTMDRSSVEVVESPDNHRSSKASDDTLTPPLSACNDVLAPPMQCSIPLQPEHIMTPDTLSDDCSSPLFSASQASFDTPRLGTGTSSMTDCHQAFAMGEPGRELRISVDDVPSLTSSRSTMTSPIIIPPGRSNLSYVQISDMLPPPPKTAGSELDGSVPSMYSINSTTAVESGRKRSSIASLSRLMLPFSSERSRNLHTSGNTRPHSQHVNRSMADLTPKKAGKTRQRLSKLMFWKSKEDDENISTLSSPSF